jgi:hypothetical protein
MFGTGFTYIDYGFFADLGVKNLNAIDLKAPEAQYFLTYRSPTLEKDIRTEAESVRYRMIDEFAIHKSFPAIAGHSYLLRTFNFPEADTLVALQVLKIDNDGATTIAWKRLADFPKPYFLYMPDDELRAKIDEVISEENLKGIKFTVKDNWVYMRGSDAIIDSLYNELKSRQIRFRFDPGQLH